MRPFIRRLSRRYLPPGSGDPIPLAFGYPRDQFEFNMPPVIQTPGAEFETCRRAARPYRLDQPGNPRGDPAEEPALIGRQFVQVPYGRQIPVHFYSMPNLKPTGKRMREIQHATG